MSDVLNPPKLPLGVDQDDIEVEDETGPNHLPVQLGSTVTPTGRTIAASAVSAAKLGGAKSITQEFTLNDYYASELCNLPNIPAPPGPTIAPRKTIQQQQAAYNKPAPIKAAQPQQQQQFYQQYQLQPQYQQQQQFYQQGPANSYQQPVSASSYYVKPASHQHQNQHKHHCRPKCDQRPAIRPVEQPPCDRSYLNNCTNICNENKPENGRFPIYPYTCSNRARRFGCFRVRRRSSSSCSSSSSSCSSSSSSSSCSSSSSSCSSSSSSSSSCSSSSSSSCSSSSSSCSSSSSSSCSSSSSSSSSCCGHKKHHRHHHHRRHGRGDNGVRGPCWRPIAGQACGGFNGHNGKARW